MDVIEGGSKIQTANKMFGVFVMSLRNHLYGINQSCKQGKVEMLQKEKGKEFVQYVKKM
jgi:hypothetical protein